MRKRLSFPIALLAVFLAAGFVSAVVIYSDGVRFGPTDKMNVIGPTVTESGGRTTLDFTEITGGLTVDDDIYSEVGVIVDGSLYLNGRDGMIRPLFLPQSDGGCSACGVDSGGTTFTCVDQPCPNGMTH